jgi:hypothetical protein
LVCLAVLAGAPAHAARQLDARDEPATQGPLELAGQECDDQTLKSDGKPVVKVSFCIFFYQFNSLFELDLSNDYGVAWAQATFDAMPGLCTSKLSFYVEVSPGTQIFGRTPTGPARAKKAGRISAEIPVSANANALQGGSVSQEFLMLPGKMAPTDLEEASRVGVSWTGRSPNKVAFVTGAEIGWPALETPEMRLGADTITLTSGKGC